MRRGNQSRTTLKEFVCVPEVKTKTEPYTVSKEHSGASPPDEEVNAENLWGCSASVISEKSDRSLQGDSPLETNPEQDSFPTVWEA